MSNVVHTHSPFKGREPGWYACVRTARNIVQNFAKAELCINIFLLMAVMVMRRTGHEVKLFCYSFHQIRAIITLVFTYKPLPTVEELADQSGEFIFDMFRSFQRYTQLSVIATLLDMTPFAIVFISKNTSAEDAFWAEDVAILIIGVFYLIVTVVPLVWTQVLLKRHQDLQEYWLLSSR